MRGLKRKHTYSETFPVKKMEVAFLRAGRVTSNGRSAVTDSSPSIPTSEGRDKLAENVRNKTQN
jgi:hypothetical protein